MSQTVITTEIQASLSPDELLELSGLPEEVFHELEDIGAFDEFLEGGRYISRSFIAVSKANRLRRSFGLDSNALAILIHYIAETEELKDRIRHLRVCGTI